MKSPLFRIENVQWTPAMVKLVEDTLTTQQWRVFNLIRQRLRSKEIAEELGREGDKHYREHYINDIRYQICEKLKCLGILQKRIKPAARREPFARP
jgi:hypothetical protein